MDRNFYVKLNHFAYLRFALHPEGVDRNLQAVRETFDLEWSPSTRRAWIEIGICGLCQAAVQKSPSTRRAWIEIVTFFAHAHANRVALHPEGVDRNSADIDAVLAAAMVALHPEGVDRNNVQRN